MTADAIVARCQRTTGRKWRWLPGLARRYVEIFGDKLRPRQREVVQFLIADEGFQRASKLYRSQLEVAHWAVEPQRMQPAAAARVWNLPPIESVGALADWLRLTPSELVWFADLKALTSRHRSPQLRHYHYRILAKNFGSIRLIEAPKTRLKLLQRQILTEILYQIPSHPAAHGFVPGRSIQTFAAPHVGRQVVLRMDLQDFFPSITGPRVQTFFRTAGYPEAVADLLGSICTTAASPEIWHDMEHELAPGTLRGLLRETRDRYARPHLPQGAPTSPALANLCTYRVDCRLSGFAQSIGAHYTRYADDLAFSGDTQFGSRIESFAAQAGAILLEEGFRVHHRKTRIMRQGVRQYLAGLVTNQRINVVRADFDLLKAILTNCVRHGPASQNRENHPSFQSHLAGRIGFVESINPAKAERLRKIFNQIQWKSS
jgi:RNA-directed DNA polymerase